MKTMPLISAILVSTFYFICLKYQLMSDKHLKRSILWKLIVNGFYFRKMIHLSRLKRFWIHLCLLKFSKFKFPLEKNWCCQLNTMNNVPVTKTFWQMTGKLPEPAIHVYRKRQLLLLELSFHSPYHQRWKLFLCSQCHIWYKKQIFNMKISWNIFYSIDTSLKRKEKKKQINFVKINKSEAYYTNSAL